VLHTFAQEARNHHYGLHLEAKKIRPLVDPFRPQLSESPIKGLVGSFILEVYSSLIL
jgi:hypothetical protein